MASQLLMNLFQRLLYVTSQGEGIGLMVDAGSDFDISEITAGVVST